MNNEIKNQVLKHHQIEQHEIGLTFEEYDCPLCGGTGEISGEDPDGLEYSDECSDCNGEGIVYVTNDTKPLVSENLVRDPNLWKILQPPE